MHEDTAKCDCQEQHCTEQTFEIMFPTDAPALCSLSRLWCQKGLTSTKLFDDAKTEQRELVGQMREKAFFHSHFSSVQKILEEIIISLHWAAENSTAQI